MNTKPNHTPIPWTFKGDHNVVGNDGRTLVATVSRNRIADGELICRAVNAHEELIAALELCARELKGMHSFHHPTCEGGCPFDQAHAQARAAIAKAKGETI